METEMLSLGHFQHLAEMLSGYLVLELWGGKCHARQNWEQLVVGSHRKGEMQSYRALLVAFLNYCLQRLLAGIVQPINS